jgi:putative DNA primase/helicase
MGGVAMSDALMTALTCAADGWPVFPIRRPVDGKCTCKDRDTCDVPGKHPHVTEWPERATTDPAQIQAWARYWPGCNWGCVTGPRSGLLDIESDGETGRAALAQLEATHGNLPETRSFRSPSGSVHYLFRYPDGSDIRNSAGIIAPNVDVRGTAGMFVLPGSEHRLGGRYAWAFADEPIADLPPAWVALLARPARTTGPTVAPERIPDGQRNEALFREACAMRRRGWTCDEIRDALMILNRRCDPPLDAGEIADIAASSRRYPPAAEAPVSGRLLNDLTTNGAAAELAMLRVGIAARDRIRRNRGLGNAKDTAAALWIEAQTAHAAGRARADGWFPVAVAALAPGHPAAETLTDLAGRSADTVSRDLKLLERAGVLALRRETTFAEWIDTDTGEIVTGPRALLSLRLLVPLDRLAATLASLDLRAVGRKTKVPAICPACGVDAGVTLKREIVCDGCGHVTPLPDLHKEPQGAVPSPEPPPPADAPPVSPPLTTAYKEPQVAGDIRYQYGYGKEPQVAVPWRSRRLAPTGLPSP